MSVEFITPDGLHKNPAFSQVVTVPSNTLTIYIGGQNSVSSSGEIIGKGDIGLQAKQIFKNLETALSAVGAKGDKRYQNLPFDKTECSSLMRTQDVSAVYCW